MSFEETKQRKLQRIPGLRLATSLGMIAWLEGHYGEAEQYLRLIHPLAWVWVFAMFVFGLVAQGIPETIRDLRYSIKHDTVWF